MTKNDHLFKQALDLNREGWIMEESGIYPSKTFLTTEGFKISFKRTDVPYKVGKLLTQLQRTHNDSRAST